jgi:hypothetical protein
MVPRTRGNSFGGPSLVPLGVLEIRMQLHRRMPASPVT